MPGRRFSPTNSSVSAAVWLATRMPWIFFSGSLISSTTGSTFPALGAASSNPTSAAQKKKGYFGPGLATPPSMGATRSSESFSHGGRCGRLVGQQVKVNRDLAVLVGVVARMNAMTARPPITALDGAHHAERATGRVKLEHDARRGKGCARRASTTRRPSSKRAPLAVPVADGIRARTTVSLRALEERGMVSRRKRGRVVGDAHDAGMHEIVGQLASRCE